MNSLYLGFRWHSRAGQGAITASQALAEILQEKFFVQSFANFGAEKRGAPVSAFNRITAQKSWKISPPKKVNNVILLDPSLIFSGEVPASTLTAGLSQNGSLLVNAEAGKLPIRTKQRVFFVPASKIALREIGRDIPNVVLLASLVQIFQLTSLNNLLTKLKKILNHLPPEVVAGNLRAAKTGFRLVQDQKPVLLKGQTQNLHYPKKLPTWQNLPNGAILASQKNSSEAYATGNWVRLTAAIQTPSKCQNCNQYRFVCPEEAIKFNAKGQVTRIDSEKCKACGICVTEFPPGALTMKPKIVASG